MLKNLDDYGIMFYIDLVIFHVNLSPFTQCVVNYGFLSPVGTYELPSKYDKCHG